MSRITQVMKEWNKAVSKRLTVRVGNYIYTVDVFPPYFKDSKWFAKFMNPEIDNFAQSWPITKKDIVEYINEEYPERV